jgi:hypothetical protein
MPVQCKSLNEGKVSLIIGDVLLKDVRYEGAHTMMSIESYRGSSPIGEAACIPRNLLPVFIVYSGARSCQHVIFVEKELK